MIAAPFPARIAGGGVITFKGPANIAVYWTLVGLDSQGQEVGAYGSLKWSFTKTDSRGYATNHWFAPTDPGLTGRKDLVKVSYGTG